MYAVGPADQPFEITDVPQSCTGAPCPMILAGEHSLHLAYYLHCEPFGWNRPTTRMISDSKGNEPCALISFKNVIAHMFGLPNDETFDSHPLAARGLHPYAVFEVRSSSWQRSLEEMSRVHPRHNPGHDSRHKHFVFAFHDTTFECVAESFDACVRRGSVRSTLLSVSPER